MNNVEIQRGQIWKENDPRFPNSFKKIVDVSQHEVRIISCDEAGNTIINSHTGKAAPRRMVKRERFNGGPGGYSLVKAAANG